MMMSLCLADEKEKKTEITLKGSVEIVSDFFFTAINSILYQRGTCTTVLQKTVKHVTAYFINAYSH